MKFSTLHKGQHVLVVGAGISGMAACRLLQSKGCEVCLTDGRARQEQDKDDLRWLDAHNIVQEFGVHHESTFLRPDLIVVSPGVPLSIEPLQAARQAGVPIIGELELGALYFDGDIIAITGTNGKTTVTTMIGECLQKTAKTVFVGGNIGTPFCAHVLRGTQADVAVLEVSSFQLDSNRDFHPRVGLLLNISPDHLDRYASYEAYADSKMGLFAMQTSNDVAIICATDTEVMARRDKLVAKVVEFDNDSWCVNVEQSSLSWKRSDGVDETYLLHDLQLQQPNLQNCMAAIAGCRYMGASTEAVQNMLHGFAIPNHRLSSLGTWSGIDFINDSKATNIGAVRSALAGMEKPVILIAGGRDKGGDYGLLDAEVQRIVKAMVLIGEAATLMQTTFASLTDVVLATDMDDAVRQAVAKAREGDVILLSPACASFDMYTSYSERGNKFRQAVEGRMDKRDNNHDSPTTKTMQRAV